MLRRLYRRFVVDPKRRRLALRAVRQQLADELPEVMHRASFRVVHTSVDACWIECDYLDPPNTFPPRSRLFAVLSRDNEVTERPIAEIVQFEWWAKAPLDYAEEQRRAHSSRGA